MTTTLPRSSRATLLALLAAAAACGADSTPDDRAGGPLATLSGRLEAGGSGAPGGPVRLALAWYPAFLSDAAGAVSAPGAIVTQDVAYSGGLPRGFRFEVAAAPPAAALAPMPDGLPGDGAVGVLLAYEDLNGNGKLDPIPAEGPPVDRVVGASLDWMRAPAFLVVYASEPQPAWTGLSQGVNLVRLEDAETSAVVPATTPVPISVSQGEARLDLFVCEAAWDGSGAQAPCGLDLGGDAPGEPSP